MNQKTYNIFFSANDWFSQHLCVCIFSLLDNIPNWKFISIYILNENISNTNKNKIKKSLEKFVPKKTFKINFINIKKHLQKHKSSLNTSYYDISTYNRLLIPEIFPDIDIWIYTDCDTIFTWDITTIRDFNLWTNLIGAVLEPIWVDYYKKILKIKSNRWYFNGWLLYMNLKKIRGEKLFQKVLEYINENKKDILFADQDWLNAIFANKWLQLPAKYNRMITVSLSRSYKDTIYSKKEYSEAMISPVMIHFNGNLKPRAWNCFYGWAEKYKEYLLKTEYKWFKIKRNHLQYFIYLFKKRIINKLPQKIYTKIIKTRRSIIN